HAFNKNGGNLGTSGSVSFMFDRKGYIVILNEDGTLDEDEVTLEAIEAGAEDIEVEEEVFEIFTTPESFKDVSDHLIESGYDLEEAEITLIPQNYSQLSSEDEEKMINLIDMLENDEDVQDVHHNLETN